MFTVGCETKPLERLAPAASCDPALDAELLLRRRLVQPLRGLRRASPSRPAEIGRALSAKPSIAGSLPSARDERRERLHEVPRRAVEARRLLEWTSFVGPRPHFSPLETSSQLDDALGAERDRDDAVRVLRGAGHEDAGSASQRRRDLGPAHDLREVRRADLLLALGDEHEVDGQLPARAADRVERGEERGLRALLVDRAAAHEDLAEARACRRARASNGGEDHSGGIDLLDVVHEVEADRPRRAGVERREDARLPVGRHAHGACGSPRRCSSRIISSQPSAMPRFSAAIDGWRIQSCRRATASSWRLAISARTGSRSADGLRRARPGGKREGRGADGGTLEKLASVHGRDSLPSASRRPAHRLLKYFSSSSSVIDSTTGRPCGQVKRSASSTQSASEAPDLLRREVVPDRHGRPAREARGEPVAPLGGSSAAPVSASRASASCSVSAGSRSRGLGRQRRDRVGAARHRLDLEAGGRQVLEARARASRPPRASPRRARAGGAAARGRGPTRCGRGSARRGSARARRAGR